MNKNKIKILITGGAGYIGSMLSTKLVFLGYEVSVLDSLVYSKSSLNHLHIYKNFKLIHGDVRDKKLIKKIIKKFDFIIPLAALVGAPLCAKHKKLAIDINLNSIQYLMECKDYRQKVIFLTSNSGYGVGQKTKYCDESSPLKPTSLYGKTKSEAETTVLKYKNSVCFRLATVFGFSYRMRTDLLVNNFVYNAVKYNKLNIFEPHFRRNFIHISDVVNGIIFVILNFNKFKSNVYNLGLSTANISKISLANKIKNYSKSLKIKIIKNRKDPDQRDYFVSNRKIEKKGFKAQISLDDGIKEMIKIFKIDSKKIQNNY